MDIYSKVIFDHLSLSSLKNMVIYFQNHCAEFIMQYNLYIAFCVFYLAVIIYRIYDFYLLYILFHVNTLTFFPGIQPPHSEIRFFIDCMLTKIQI